MNATSYGTQREMPDDRDDYVAASGKDTRWQLDGKELRSDV